MYVCVCVCVCMYMHTHTHTYHFPRTARTKALEDVNDKCFITGLDRFEFHTYPGEWEMRSGEKFAWRYLLFLRHLSNKKRCESSRHFYSFEITPLIT